MKTQQNIALVTGGSRGLGKNMVLQLAQKGTDIVFTYHSRKEEAAEVVAQVEQMGQKAISLQLDTGKVATFDSFTANLGSHLKTTWNTTQVNFLVNNAGIEANSLIQDTTEEAFDHLFNVHFKGVYFLTQKMLPLLADKGRVVNLSTGLARFVTPGYAAYSSMKGAIENFTRYLAKELGGRGITANTVAPGPIETDFTKSTFDSHPGVREYLASQTALGRLGQPEDIGGIVAFLCSEEARWITAQRIEASGGTFI